MWTIVLCLLAVEPDLDSVAPSNEQLQFFETVIRPVLAEHCLKCHGADKQWGDFRLDTREGLLKGGEGGDVVVPGKPKESRLIEAVRQTNPDFKMPPEGKLTDRQIGDLSRWIELGMPYPKSQASTTRRHRDPNHWAFQPLQPQQPPTVVQTRLLETPIDQFIQHKLEQVDLVPTERSDKSVLMRRLTFDLLGLPPAPDEFDDFMTDERPDATDRLIDRLLASPHYGERWGRHWLDVARYADSNGFDENVAHGNAWRYRDYVVAAFNRDQPFQLFLTQQLAGDLLPADDEAQRREFLIATGFLSIGPKVLAEVDQAKMQMDIVDEQIESVGKAMLGMTFGCARCHDHKFDPLPTADYYGLAGIFKSTRTMDSYIKVARWHEHPLPSDEARAMQATFDQQVLERQTAVDKYLAEATEAIRLKATDQKLPENPEQQFSPETQQKLKELRDGLAAFKNAGADLPTAMGVSDDQVADVAIHIRGNPQKLGEVVPRHVPPVMRGLEPPQFEPGHSGRVELAAWITNPRHPLTSRVIVNRLWRWHFGRGIVPSTDNFGVLGEKPSHPELLDWMAQRFVADGWSIKTLHRRIVNSHVYQQDSAARHDRPISDVENRWLGRFPVRRLDAEQIRDSLLSVSGRLNSSMGGSLLSVKNRAYFFDHTSIDKTDYHSARRSIYLPVVRNNVYDLFQLLDFPDPAVPTGDRAATTVAPQALLMMNSDFVMQAASDVAEHLTATPSDDRQRLDRLFVLAYGRHPTESEVTSNLAFLNELREQRTQAASGESAPAVPAWDLLCHVLLAANEFVYLR